MPARSLAIASFALAAFSLAGCAPTETGNPPMHDSLLLSVKSSDPEAVAVTPDTGDLTVESIWQGVEALGFQTCDGTDLYLREPGTTTATELVSGYHAVAVGSVPAGSYCVMFLGETRVPASEDVPPELQTVSFFASGHRKDGAPFEVLANGANLEHTFAEPLVRGSDAPPLLLELDVAALFPGLGLDALAPNGDGIVRLDLSTDSAGFRTSYRAAVGLYGDTNGNGEVDSGEPRLF